MEEPPMYREYAERIPAIEYPGCFIVGAVADEEEVEGWAQGADVCGIEVDG